MSIKLKNRGKRAPNLGDEGIERIVRLLDSWSLPKLTWELLINQIQENLGVRYTRQALDRHTRISDAYQARKRKLGTEPPPATPEEARIRSLESEVSRLKRENLHLLEQFKRWLYNVSRVETKTWEEDWRQHRDEIRKQLDKALPESYRPGVRVGTE